MLDLDQSGGSDRGITGGTPSDEYHDVAERAAMRLRAFYEKELSDELPAGSATARLYQRRLALLCVSSGPRRLP